MEYYILLIVAVEVMELVARLGHINHDNYPRIIIMKYDALNVFGNCIFIALGVAVLLW